MSNLVMPLLRLGRHELATPQYRGAHRLASATSNPGRTDCTSDGQVDPLEAIFRPRKSITAALLFAGGLPLGVKR